MEYHQITIYEALKEQEKESKRVFCKRCHRELKNVNAKQLGYGPSCYRKYIKEHEGDNRKKLFAL